MIDFRSADQLARNQGLKFPLFRSIYTRKSQLALHAQIIGLYIFLACLLTKPVVSALRSLAILPSKYHNKFCVSLPFEIPGSAPVLDHRWRMVLYGPNYAYNLKSGYTINPGFTLKPSYTLKCTVFRLEILNKFSSRFALAIIVSWNTYPVQEYQKWWECPVGSKSY